MTTSMTRSIPPWLTPITQELELERPIIVTSEYVADLQRKFGVRSPANRIIEHLADRGWLVKTRIRGAWEFIPAERAGAISTGSPWLEFRASLALNPEFPAAIALGSALFMNDLTDRPPPLHEIALPPTIRLPSGLKETYRVVRHAVQTSLVYVDGLPVHSPASILVHIAARPTDVRSWSSIMEILPELMSVADKTDIRMELDGRPHATLVRFAYLYEHMIPDMVQRLGIMPTGKVWFGPRGPLKRHSSRWNLADTILPVAPGAGQKAS